MAGARWQTHASRRCGGRTRRNQPAPRSLFEWDTAKAAYKFLLWQARTVIQSVKLVASTVEKTQIQAPYYVRDTSAGKEQGYVSVLTLQKDPEQARESLRLEFGRAESALTRAKALAAALNMEDEIDALIIQLTGLRERVTTAEEQPAA